MAQGAVQLEPMSRINAVLAVARRPEGLDLVRNWVSRLDRSDPGAAGVKVYRLQYAQAKAVASALNDLFGNGGGPAGGSDKDQLEPSGRRRARPAARPAVAGGQAAGSGSARRPGGVRARCGRHRRGFGASGQRRRQRRVLALRRPEGRDDERERQGQGGDRRTPGAARRAAAAAKIRVTADPASNSLLINASASDYKLVERAIRQMDRQPVQVAIEATIAEVTLTDQLQYGVQFFLQGNTSLGLGGATRPAGLRASTRRASTSWPAACRARACWSTRCRAIRRSRSCPRPRSSCSTASRPCCRSATRCRSSPAPRNRSTPAHGAGRQQRRLQGHRHHPQRAAQGQRQRRRDARRRAADQRRRVDRPDHPHADDLAAPGAQLGRGRRPARP